MNTWRETVEKNEYLQNNKTGGWSGTDDKDKGKPGMGKGKTKARAKARTTTKERVYTTARKGRKDSTEWRSTTTRKTYKPVKITQNGRTRVGIMLTSGMTQTGGQTIGAQICGLTLHGYKRHYSCHRRNLLNNSPIQHTEAAFQC